MIPILYEKDERQFTSNGLGRLSDCLRCTVTEERNGIFECEFDYPVTGWLYSEIYEGRIIAATHDDTKAPQPFDIYARSAEIAGIVTFYAHHISYRLSNVPVWPCTAGSAAEALQAIKRYSMATNPFTFWTNKSVTGAWTNTVPRSARSLLAGTEGSILDRYGTGEYKWDKFEVRLYTRRGSDRATSIRYGVNLTDMRRTQDISGCYTAVAPFWQSTDGATVVLPEGIVTASSLPTSMEPWTTSAGDTMTTNGGTVLEFNAPVVTVKALDLSDAFEEQPTVEQLRAKAQDRVNGSDGWEPDENLTIDFAAIWQTTEYAGVAAAFTVRLCDTILVYNNHLGVNGARMKVIKTVYNTLLDRYDQIELGNPKRSYTDTVLSLVDGITKDFVTNVNLDQAVSHATELITGGLGGYVVLNTNANGQPQELLIMDTPDIGTAVNVWRFNRGGLGHSHSGYNGPYNDVALTADGKINANMITTGSLNAALITTGTLLASVIGAGTITAEKLAAGAVTADKIATGAITVGKLSTEVSNSITTAQTTADNAATAASNASTLAAGKATVYYRTADPSAGNYSAGDIWVKNVSTGTSGDVMWTYSGSAWVKHEIGTTTIIDGSITTDLLAANAVVADKIATNAITAGKIATGAVTAAKIDSGAITTEKLDATGALSVKGSFEASQWDPNGTIKLALATSEQQSLGLALYLDNVLQGFFGYDMSRLGIHRKNASQVTLNAYTTNQSGEVTGGSSVIAGSNGQLRFKCSSIIVGGPLETEQTGKTGTFTSANGKTISVKNGIITGIT